MEGLVHRLASAEELFERVEGLKRQMQTIASQREVARVEERILKLAERAGRAAGRAQRQGAFSVASKQQLGGLAAEFDRGAAAAEVGRDRARRAACRRYRRRSARWPRPGGRRISPVIEERISELVGTARGGSRSTGDTLARLERRLGDLSDQIESAGRRHHCGGPCRPDREGGLARRRDRSSGRSGARRDIEGLGSKLDQLASRLRRRRSICRGGRSSRSRRGLRRCTRRSRRSTSAAGYERALPAARAEAAEISDRWPRSAPKVRRRRSPIGSARSRSASPPSPARPPIRARCRRRSRRSSAAWSCSRAAASILRG